MACEIITTTTEAYTNKCYAQKELIPFCSLQVVIILLQLTPCFEELGGLLLEHFQLAWKLIDVGVRLLDRLVIFFLIRAHVNKRKKTGSLGSGTSAVNTPNRRIFFSHRTNFWDHPNYLSKSSPLSTTCTHPFLCRMRNANKHKWE